MKLTKERRLVVVGAAIAIIVLGIYLIFYAPLMKKLRTTYIECKSIENDVLEVRNIIESARGAQERRILITKDASHAIREVTDHGRLNAINFISMSPKKVRKEKGSRYKILPIEMEIKSTYEQIGIFLGLLDELDKTLVTVKSFNIIPDKEGPSKLTADLVIYVYLSESKAF